MTPAEFRLLYPEFISGSYTDPMVQRWLSMAVLRLDANRWDQLLDEGMALFVAHNLILSGPVAGQPGVGGVSGQAGIVSSKSVSKVSVGYESSAVALDQAGNYNLTRYGRDFWMLSQSVGIGGIQL